MKKTLILTFSLAYLSGCGGPSPETKAPTPDPGENWKPTPEFISRLTQGPLSHAETLHVLGSALERLPGEETLSQEAFVQGMDQALTVSCTDAACLFQAKIRN
jgi:hypothetical protein